LEYVRVHQRPLKSLDESVERFFVYFDSNPVYYIDGRL
jgi:hypothetical protein